MKTKHPVRRSGVATLCLLTFLMGASTPVFADKWNPAGPGADGRTINRVWFTGAAGFAVGYDGMIRHTTDAGFIWNYDASGTIVNLNDVWGTDAAHVWAVGDSGMILYYDGSTWTTQTSGTTNQLLGVWGSDANNVWAVGGGGTILKWNGSTWTAQSSGTTAQLNAVSGIDQNNVWTVGNSGTIRRWNGSTWTSQTSNTTNNLNGVFAGDSTNVWAVGDSSTIRRWDGAAWATLTAAAANFRDVWGMSVNSVWTVWVVGSNGSVRRTQGGTWAVENSSTTDQLNGIWGDYDHKVYAVGNDGTIIERDGNADLTVDWTTQVTGTSNSMFGGIWGADGSNIWAVGGSGVSNMGTVMKWNGAVWDVQTVVASPPLTDFPSLGVYAATQSDVWLVGAGGGIMKWDGSNWSSQSSGTTQTLHAVWGLSANSVWAVGNGGVIRFWNGSTWSTQTSPTTMALYGVWGADGNNVWAVGQDGIIIKWNGTSWSAVSQGGYVLYTLTDVYGTSATNVWAVGHFGRILKWNGTSWTQRFPPADSNLYDVWAADANNVWAVGDNRNWPTAAIWKSTNGGASWLPDTTYTGQAHFGIWGTSPENVYVAGSAGLVFANEPPEIAVEQPAGTNLTDGSAVSFGNGSVTHGTGLSFTIRNTGTANLVLQTITIDGTNAGDFAVTSPPTSPVIPGGSTTFTVTFTAGAVGSRSAALHIPSNDSDESPFDISVSGTGITPEIAIEQPSGTTLTDASSIIAYGVTPPGTPVVKTFTIRNTGTENLTGLSVTKDGASAADFTVGTLATTVAPGASTTFDVTFNPAMPGDKIAAIHVASNDLDENAFDITLAGNGSGGLIATYKEGANDPFTGTAYAGTEDLWLFNNSGGATDQNTGGDGRVITGGLGGVSDRHELMRFNLSSLVGRFSSINSVTLRLYFNGANTNTGTVQVFALAAANAGWVEGTGGTGGTAPNGVSTWGHRVRTTQLWAGSAGASTAGTDYVNTVLASTPYAAAATGQSFDLVLPDASIINTWLSGPNAGFYLRTILQNNQVIFHSSESTAALRPELIINYNASVPEIAVEQPAGAGLTDGSSTIDFGSTMTGTPIVKTFTVKNTGSGDLTGLVVTKDGTHPDDFTVGALSATTVTPGNSATFDVAFSPAAVGARSSAIHIASNDADENPFDISLTGTGTAPEIALHNGAATGAPQLTDGQSTVVDFGITGVGSVVTRDFTIANTGTGSLTISGITAPTGFTVLNAPGAAIAASATHTFQVRLDASGSGTFSGSVVISSNDTDEASFDFPVTGTVQDAAFQGWASTSGLSGPDLGLMANPAGDGIVNLLKYAFNMDPTVPDVDMLATGTGTAGLPVYGRSGSGATSFFHIEFIRRTGGGLIYTPKKSTNLTTWVNLTSTPTVTSIDANWERVVHEEPYDGTTTANLFGMVEVTLP